MKEQQRFQLDPEAGYFRGGGVEVMAFSDFYPEGHQSGVSVILHGNRIAANGDIRFEATPGQWQPVPKQLERRELPEENAVVTTLAYPDVSRHLNGFNPMIYPDFEFRYTVKVQGGTDESGKPAVTVTVQPDRPIPERFAGKLRFNMELFPGALFGEPWIMDSQTGVFPRQPNGPTLAQPSNLPHTGHFEGETVRADWQNLVGSGEYSPIAADDVIAEPYAAGKRFTLCPGDPLRRLTVEALTGTLELYDGRMNHNNGWFVLSAPFPTETEENALRWVIVPHVEECWRYIPVVQVSQVGYHPAQPKQAVVELDARQEAVYSARLLRVTENGLVECRTLTGTVWGRFLRYRYITFDFSDVTEEGLYQISYLASYSEVFRIAKDVYDRGVWQPVLEYFLPVQMCHMRVNEKYRVWHGLCHHDDARMAPENLNHIDGYSQGSSTLSSYAPGDVVPGLNAGGWHDAGDFDLRVESQSGEVYILSLACEEFGVDYDATTIDEVRQVVEIHQPDGKNDILQQIVHGLLSVLGGIRAFGRPYRGIICPSLRQYVLLGDGANMTDGIPGNDDDRWVFTEDNPAKDLTTAAHLAAAARVLRGFDDAIASESLEAAERIVGSSDDAHLSQKLHAVTELYLTTKKGEYREYLLAHTGDFVRMAGQIGWIACRAASALNDGDFTAALREALVPVKEDFERRSAETPYGIPYRPHIWGAGWDIQSMGFRYYFLRKTFPELFGRELLCRALDFVLGCHPGSNNASFASGVGAKSATTAYGANRADWSYIPGGVISGTALIRPDLPELLTFPFLWQQTEYVLGGGSSNYMFLVLAVRKLYGEAPDC